MRQPGQILMFSDVELEVIKKTFANNEDLLFAVRKVLLQGELTEEEKKMIKAFITPEAMGVIRKRILPEIDLESPFGQIGNLLFTLQDHLKVKGVEEMTPLFEAKSVEIHYLNQQLEILADIDGKIIPTVRLKDLATFDGKEPSRLYADITAYNFILGYVDPMLLHLKTMAGQKTETIEEVKKRIQRDSNK